MAEPKETSSVPFPAAVVAPSNREGLESSTLIKLRNILFATDFSPSSEAAMHHTLGIARRYDAQVYVTHVIRPDAYQLVPPEALVAAADQARRYAEQQMTKLLVSGRLRDIRHQVLLAQGELWPVISKLSQQHDIHLIVVGTHGRTGVRKLLLGSVAEEVFRMSSLPVLTVGPKVSSETKEEEDFRRILYATDFTPNSDRARAYAFSLAQEHQANLTLLHMVKDVGQISAQNSVRLKDYFLNHLRNLIPKDAELWCAPEVDVGFGDPADGILKAAADAGADLIVLGVRRSATFAGHLPPTTAYKVVCQANCPVLTVRG